MFFTINQWNRLARPPPWPRSRADFALTLYFKIGIFSHQKASFYRYRFKEK